MIATPASCASLSWSLKKSNFSSAISHLQFPPFFIFYCMLVHTVGSLATFNQHIVDFHFVNRCFRDTCKILDTSLCSEKFRLPQRRICLAVIQSLTIKIVKMILSPVTPRNNSEFFWAMVSIKSPSRYLSSSLSFAGKSPFSFINSTI